MTGIRETLRAVLDFLGPGNLVLGIVLLVATPFVDRFLIRRKRISYRVHYNSKIGLGPEKLHDDGPGAGPRQLASMSRLLDRMSIVVIRIRNTGGYDISADDFDKPLSFTFGKRVVWNARISEAGSDEIREQLRAGLRFFRNGTDPAPGNGERDNLLTVREKLSQRMVRWIGGQAPAPQEPETEPRWHGVRLDGLSLKRKQKFKLVVVLEEPADTPEGETSKEIESTGKLGDNGIIKDEKRQRRVTLPRLTGALALVLTGFLVLSLVFASPPTDPSVACGSGELSVQGSSVFMPTMKSIARDYLDACTDAKILTQATGSIDGVRTVAALSPADAGTLAALSDGRHRGEEQGLYAQQLAIVVYHVVVNSSVGLDTISTADLRKVYDGTYQDWSQLRGGAPLPIRIVGRGQESGTRELFEQRVLGTGEDGLSSNECLAKDRNPGARTTRCERDSNSEVVAKISSIPGTIGYADAPSVAEARKSNALNALSLDGKVFDAAGGIESEYPFWTVEYLYTRGEPAAGSLLASFVKFVRTHDSARLRLKDAGYLPCTTAERTQLELCNSR
ncbi:substrate-binding domain-containing protein [Actinokineospora sp. NBRC 105648]|uniref:PstS family phosphate ABC transporter substrate-binding protein n=1 Tax=Actinokineospora sp. NBRC 105648 TaxID=3032206 RepID=UPI00249FD8E0|nr:substrate-binding domain-containing protein [Actinokineospora sp. NBRC 105648]GLZ36495.1 phosphate ABC transporter substrate-binding protein [Actinokineospora sp. NBRC 105648]